MKILDRYVAKNFLIGYVIAFCVLIGLRIIIELFVNLDEFAELGDDLGAWAVAKHVLAFYGMRMTLYFRDISGMITVVAAAFSLGKMVRANELVAIIASGVSAKRIVGPILVLAIFFTGLGIVNQELVIPSISDKLVRDADEVPGEESYPVYFISDGQGSLINASRYYVKTRKLAQPTIILRRRVEGTTRWEVTGSISADEAVSADGTELWTLANGRLISTEPNEPPRAMASYRTVDLLPRDIPVRHKQGFDALLSSRQLTALAAQKTKIKDMARLISQKHFRITEPLISLTMLMVSLPVLICRDPKTMKSAVMVSFALTGACFVTSFACRMLATEVVFDRIMPEFWPWVPLFIFLPVAIIELDSMRT